MIVVSVLAAVLCLAEARASTKEERESLRGVTSMNVTVERMDGDSKSIGFNAAAVQSRIEDRLRQARIRIHEKSFNNLYFRLPALQSFNHDLIACHIDINFRQAAQLSRNSKIVVLATTWKKALMGYAPRSTCAQDINKALEQYLDAFINDYLGANE